jgi:hypothetical protein
MIQAMFVAGKTHEQDQVGEVHLGKLKAPSQSVGISHALTSSCGIRGGTTQYWRKLALSDINQEYSARQTTAGGDVLGW